MVRILTVKKMNFLDKIKKDYIEVTDLIIKPFGSVTIVYLETLADQDKINDYILKILSNNKKITDIKSVIPSPNVKDIKTYEELCLFLESGFTILFNKNTVIAIETKSDLNRSIDTPSTEATLYGPKDALVENYQTNLGLIKRRVKSKRLKNIVVNVGVYTKTTTSLLYIDGLAKKEIVSKTLENLRGIKIDGVTDIGELKPHLVSDKRNVFPGIKITERPDVIADALLKGKIVVLLDTSPYALILPTFLADFINPMSDKYTKPSSVNFIKILRLFCFFIAIFVPAFYVAVTTINQETIPTSLLINLQNQRMNVPFPAVMECVITLIICEILRESDIRFPSSYGSAISILGALILGEAAVSAGIVSPIMIIVASMTFISSMIFTDTEIIDALRYWRFIALFIAAVFGLYGVGLSIILLFINLSNYEVNGHSYLYPIAPFDKVYLKETLIKLKNNKRSRILSNNRIKGRL